MTAPVILTIGGTPYPFIEDTLDIKRKISEARRLQVTVLDYAGTATFQYREQITVTDSVLGIRYAGFIIDDKLDKSNVYPDPTVEHQLDCTDNMAIPAKRTSNRLYTTPTSAGKIVTDMINDVLQFEGVATGYAVQSPTTTADWNTGQTSSVIGGTTTGDGDLELLSSSSLGTSYNSTAQWNTGTYSNTAAGSNMDISLIGQTRNWDDGNKSSQTLFGNGSPSDKVQGGAYVLNCSSGSETRSRLDFAGTWQNGTIEVDITISNDTVLPGVTWRTTNFGGADGGFAYAAELSTSKLDIRKGTNSSGGGSTSSLGSFTFSPKLSTGTYRLRIVMNGSSFTGYVNGTQYVSVSDGSYSAAAMIALRNRNPSGAGSNNQQFDNFGVMQAISGTWIAPGQALDAVTTIAGSVVSWDTSLSAGGTIKVETSTNNGSTYQVVGNGGSISTLAIGGSGAGLTLKIRVTLSTTTTATLPDIRNLQWSVFGGYVASGIRTTAPLGIDRYARGNQSGLGTADDGQVYTQIGTGTASIVSNRAKIESLTTDVYEILGNNSWTDCDATVRFQLSSGTIAAGIALRFVDVSNWFRLVASATQLIATKNIAGTPTTIATVSKTQTVNSFYWMRFRLFGTGPATIQGRVWLDSTLEPTSWDINTTS